MKTSLQWLSDFLPGPPALDAQQAADALTNAGLPVESIEKAGGDTVLDVEVTSNRPDCLSHLGIARELSALLARPLREPQITADESDEPTASAVSVRIDAAQLCPQYIARLIRGVKIGPSPAWMAARLEAVGIRPINNVVDVTNYVMMEMGQPLHAFDFSAVGGAKVIVRAAKRAEAFTTLDGRKRELTAAMLVIANAERPIALAGVMGGADSEVTDRTTDVLLESAIFDPLCIRRTARALAMKSDSSYRFERGIDPTLPQRAAARAAQLILQTAGGRLLKGMARAGADSFAPRTLSLRLGQLKRIVGIDLPADQVVSAFSRLGLRPHQQADRIDVTVPSHRLDIVAEIDLIEEAARVLGYDRIPTREEISIRLVPPDPESTTISAICGVLAAAGYFEAITFSFLSDALRSDFGASMLRADSSVRKADAALRPSLIPGLLEAVRFNETNGTADAKLFEIGATFKSEGAKPLEHRRLAAVGGQDVRQLRGVAEALLATLDSQRQLRVIPAHHPGFAQDACGQVHWGEQSIGYLGKIDPAIAAKISLRDTPVAMELDLAALLAGHRTLPQLRPLPSFPAVRRDLSLIVPDALRFEKIESLVRGLDLPFLEAIDFVTTYRGKPLEPGKKSVTITLVFRNPSATLTSEQVESSVQKTIAAARQELAAVLRV
jgi:phenylalanyl-tRNA synthetase beta chain